MNFKEDSAASLMLFSSLMLQEKCLGKGQGEEDHRGKVKKKDNGLLFQHYFSLVPRVMVGM